jgi:hypothetical protein
MALSARWICIRILTIYKGVVIQPEKAAAPDEQRMLSSMVGFFLSFTASSLIFS